MYVSLEIHNHRTEVHPISSASKSSPSSDAHAKPLSFRLPSLPTPFASAIAEPPLFASPLHHRLSPCIIPLVLLIPLQQCSAVTCSLVSSLCYHLSIVAFSGALPSLVLPFLVGISSCCCTGGIVVCCLGYASCLCLSFYKIGTCYVLEYRIGWGYSKE